MEAVANGPSVVMFQLYSSVQARRGANEVPADNQRKLEYDQGHRSDSQQSQNHSGSSTQPYRYSNSCNHGGNSCGFPPSHRNGYAYCHGNGVSDIGDLLQDYLEQGKQMGRKNNGTRHVVREAMFPRKFLRHVPFCMCVYETVELNMIGLRSRVQSGPY